MDGAILLHRSLLDSYAFTNEVTLKIWIWILLKASWKQSHVSITVGKADTTVTVNRGEMIYGRNKAAKELKIPANTIERHLKKLQDNLQIVRKTGTHYSIITVCKYDSYQTMPNSSGQATGRQRATNGQPTGTYNKVNKDNKEKKKGEPFTPPDISEVKAFFKEAGYTDFIAEKAYNYYNNHEWKDSKGNKVKNWKQKMQAVWFKDENKIVNKYEAATGIVVNPGARHWM